MQKINNPANNPKINVIEQIVMKAHIKSYYYYSTIIDGYYCPTYFV